MDPAPIVTVTGSTHLLSLLPLSLSELEQSLVLMCAFFKPCPNAELELSLVDDAAIAELNLAYLNCQGPTNVLSFSSLSPHSIGSLALSVETVKREALLYKQNLPFYTLKMLGHGLAHLFGYDHGDKMDKISEQAATAACKHLLNIGSTPCLKCL